MNKKEQLAFETLRQDLREARALRFPEYAPTPINVEAARVGFAWDEPCVAWTMNGASKLIAPGFFTASLHRVMWGETRLPSPPARRGASWTNCPGWAQGAGGRWYATRLEALQALRLALTKEYARELARLDGMIEDETLACADPDFCEVAE